MTLRVNIFVIFVVCDDLHPCEGLGRYATFKNFGMAFLLLFRVSTGDNWNGIMKVRLLCLFHQFIHHLNFSQGSQSFSHALYMPHWGAIKVIVVYTEALNY